MSFNNNDLRQINEELEQANEFLDPSNFFVSMSNVLFMSETVQTLSNDTPTQRNTKINTAMTTLKNNILIEKPTAIFLEGRTVFDSDVTNQLFTVTIFYI